MEEARHKQEKLNRHIIKKELEINLQKKKKKLTNINKLFNRKNDTIKFVDDYSSVILKAIKKIKF